jgi:hypothetical protein
MDVALSIEFVSALTADVTQFPGLAYYRRFE